MRAVVTVATLLLLACGDNYPGNITIRSADDFAPVLTEYAKVTAYRLPVVGLDTEPDPDSFTITVTVDASLPAQAYQLTRVSEHEVGVAAPDILGAQYGTTAALEAYGFRFRHPFDTALPKHIVQPALGTFDGEVHKPEMRSRGLHLHTLHPIEGYFAFWEPTPSSTGDAHRIIDWLIKNRGNYLQWFALDDIIQDPDRYAAWKPFTEELIAYAHMRGIKVGIELELLGAANLQNAFDLVEKTDEPIGPQIAGRMPLLTALPWDRYDLSFGEFFDADPQTFIDAVNEAYDQTHALAPDAEFHALIHVGATQRVTFMGQDLIFYFLVKFANPAIIPDIHTVMFYDLYEPAGGAYQHVDFSEHRQYLLDRMCNGLPAGYHPEAAYWVAFDDSVPQYMPLYVHNRWLDLQKLDEEPGCGGLQDHLLFSSGWEWGFWLHDVATLRATYERPADSTTLIAAEYADHPGAADVIAHLIDVQREHLMMGKLVQYVAGRDTVIDAGRQLMIVSQPDRVTFDDLATGGEDPTVFDSEVMQPLATYADKLDTIAAEFAALKLRDDRWTREIADGIAVDQVRARFVLASYRATLAQIAGNTATARSQLDTATELMDQGQAIVSRRHHDLHDALGDRLTGKTQNRTFYQFGYLFMGDTLCYWNRELVQAGGIVDGESPIIPNCVF